MTTNNALQTRRHSASWCLLVLVMLCFAVSINAELLYVLNSQSRTISRIDTNTNSVQNTFTQLGNVPNKIVLSEDYLWSVNSGDNALQKINRNTGATLSNILVAIGSNPWDAVLHDGFLYVTGLFTGKVYKINASTNSVVGNVNVGISPEALCVYGSKLYVSNTGNYAQNYAGSSVSVIDIPSFTVVSTIPVSSNPQFIREYNGLLHVSCTGNYEDIGGAVCLIDPAANALIHTIPIGGSIGGIWINPQHQALVADSNGENLYLYDAVNYTVINSSANPIANGGSEVCGNSSFVAVLQPNWGGNGTVRILHPDLSYWKQYNVGLFPTDIKLYSSPSAASDEVQTPNLLFTLSPNPLIQGQKLNLKTSSYLKGELGIYNLRGELLQKETMTGLEIAVSTEKLANGCYFYRFTGTDAKANATTRSGKFVVLK